MIFKIEMYFEFNASFARVCVETCKRLLLFKGQMEHGVYHDILALKESSHHIQNRRFSYITRQHLSSIT